MFKINLEYVYYFNLDTSYYVSDHFHNCYEFCFYFKGQGTTTINGHSISYMPNQYAVYAPNVVHDERHLTDTTVLDVAFHIKGSDKPKLESNIYIDISQTIFHRFDQIRQEYLNRCPSYIDMITLLMEEILICHTRQQTQQVYAPDEISRIRRIIDTNFTQNLNIEALLLESGYSYDYMRHAFKAKFGDSPKTYLMKQRINHSKNLLLHSNMSISEIAQNCGFCTSSQFSSIFKSHEGLTPTTYRNLHV